MKIQERYQRVVDESVRGALEKYRNRIDEITLFCSFARGEAGEGIVNIVTKIKGI